MESTGYVPSATDMKIYYIIYFMDIQNMGFYLSVIFFLGIAIDY
jgi:hypothetical protein